MTSVKRPDLASPAVTNLLTADDFLSSSSSLKRVEIPEISKDGKPGVVFLKPLTAGDILDHMKLTPERQSENNTHLIIRSVVDENGNPLFNSESAQSLRSVRASVYSRLVNEISKELKEVESGNPSSETVATT